MQPPAIDPTAIPLSLYVHVPWCARKCPYCDFNSHPLKDALPEQAYIDALLADLRRDRELHAPVLQRRQLQSIFIGGGTPSLLSATAVARLLEGIRQQIDFDPDPEVSLEANPGSAESRKFAGYRRAGVNRLSIGVQSFDDANLRALGRIHSGAEALRAVALARRAGFDNLNLDLMFGLPGQDLDQARRDIDRAVALAPEHISCYQLTIEPNTWFYRHPPALPDEDKISEMQAMVAARLEQNGYRQYEVSAFARDGRRCRHNLNYWQFGDYLGIGAGAHGKLSGPGQVLRTWKTRHPRRYLAQAGDPGRFGEQAALAAETRGLEFMLNALRLRDPVAESLFVQRTGLPIAAVADQLDRARMEGLLVRRDGAFYASELGFRFLNDLLQRFVPLTAARDSSAA